MSKITNLRAPPTNRLLAVLPRDEYERLLPQLELFPLVFGEVIYQPGDLIRNVYFPTSGIISLLAAVEDRATLEVGIVGREGMVGLPAFMEVNTSGNRAVVQGAGAAMKMKAKHFRNECENGGSLPRVLRRYTHSRMTQIAQGAACNRFHPIDARLARWLLMTRDRMGTDGFRLTQEFLSNMLGVRREGVNKAAGALQHQNLISYSRGNLLILDRAGLKAIACNCYAIIRAEYDAFKPR
ncbi:MAG TPA: Crp/Fnr family transcriptional regulator [Pyrinomonadaceae bacterium]|jgi:CRP-like cAMP-binding protein|nr:Crp/Fnr family transcriptional regulator [Pyrinomonadaceae bacterium]